MKIKILVAYHKPYKLPKGKIFVPIHVGRSVAYEKSKDGVISESDMQWLLKHMIGDDTGNNISNLNRDFCEMTALYWAWKNYDKLGNPDYIGLMHYRTFLNLKKCALHKILNTNTIIAPNIDNFLNYHNKIIGPDIKNINGVKYQNILDMNEKFLHDGFIYYKNIFIMPKKMFFTYCEMIFDILFAKYNSETHHNLREMGYLAEYITSFFIMFMKKNGVNVLELPLSGSPHYNVVKQLINVILKK